MKTGDVREAEASGVGEADTGSVDKTKAAI